MTPRAITELVIYGTIILWVGLDIAMIRLGHKDATITYVMREWVDVHPLVPGAILAVALHFVWR